MRAYVEHRGVDTQQAQEQIDSTKYRKGSGTHRHASVNRTDTQTRKVLTIQMMKMSECINIVYTETVSIYMYIDNTNTGYT